jgi:predicted RNase H-like nuclease
VTATPPVFVGIDLAWGARARTGLAAVDGAGRLVRSAVVRTDDEIDDWLRTLAGDIVVAAVDAPLIVPNNTGQRRCETEISRAFWRYKIGAHSSNRARPEFDPPRAEKLAQRFGWSVDPAWHGSVVYKSGPSRAQGFAHLIRHFASIDELRLSESPRWEELSSIVADPKPGDLTRIEDELDAILCAHLAWLWHHRPESLQVYGSLADGYIVAPPAPLAVPEARHHCVHDHGS